MNAIIGVPLAKFKMGLWRLGGASFILRARGAPVVAVDPVLKLPPGGRPEFGPAGAIPPFPPAELQADVVLYTSAKPERFDAATVEKSQMKTKAWFSGPAAVCGELEKMGMPPARFGAAVPGKRMDFDKLSIEYRACAPGREDASFLVAAGESGAKAYFASDPYHEVGSGAAEILSVPMLAGEGSAAAKFTAHVRPRWAVPCPLGGPEGGERDIMEYTIELGNLDMGEAGCRMDPVYPLLLSDDGTWVKVTDNLAMAWKCAMPVPATPLPAGYKMRNFKEADVLTLAAIYSKTYGPFYDEAWFRHSIMGDLYFSKDRCFIVEHGGKAVGSALAWEDTKVKDIGRGILYYVATDPAHQHRGLGRAVAAAVMRYFQKDGRREVRLLTADFRGRALRTYLGLGFETVEDTDEMKRRWDNVRAALEAEGQRAA